jgi:hypothetical protein
VILLAGGESNHRHPDFQSSHICIHGHATSARARPEPQ